MKLKSFLNQLDGGVFVHITDADGCGRYMEVAEYTLCGKENIPTVEPLLELEIKRDVCIYTETNPRTLKGIVPVLYITMAGRKEA